VISPDPRWESFAAREPFFAVIPNEEHRRANLTPERERAFFAAGETRVEWIFKMIEPLIPDFAPLAVLDYGCGIGRLTLPLAWRARTVVAVDRSPALVARARKEAATRGVTNTSFLTPDEFDASGRRFDLVVCHGVLQRLQPANGLALVRRLADRVSPGGIGVFHFPYVSTTPAGVRWLREVRERLPVANRLANRLRGKAENEPFIPTHTYGFSQVSDTLRKISPEATHLFLEDQDDPPCATIVVRTAIVTAGAGGSRANGATDESAWPTPAGNELPVVDVRDVIARTSIEELNRAAEAYFSTITNWDHHLAKPFAKPDEVPPLLMDAANMVQGLRLAPGAHVLDFGAGSGWLSRWLTQLGCRVTLLDVSPTALAMARELYARQPIIGDRPAPAFLQFDGRRIDLPDGSVDRVICFHAFHHVPNPDEIIREFSRVLAPGGIAAFAEPGPRHSRTPLSQFEMRAYAVVENDIDVHAIWDTARAAGFADIKLVVCQQVPFHVSLDEFEDLLTGGPANDRWTAQTRAFLRNFRSFFLTKAGGASPDSRTTAGLACRLTVDPPPEPVLANQPSTFQVTVTNSGTARWLPWGGLAGVAVGAHLYDAAGAIVNFDFCSQPPSDPVREIAPGETLKTPVTLPALPTGRYLVEFDCVAAGVTWFAQQGSRPVRLALDVQ
jgi:2-polyprenyl-3-methyl-5-hydroxy-6-metoxy-1,4-benzoquinol methylase